MPVHFMRLRPFITGVAASLCGAWALAAETSAAPQSSFIDAPLFYQLLIGEMELREGKPGAAFSIIFDAARRSSDEALFKRAVEIAIRSQAGAEALAATQAWRKARPESLEAVRTQVQILLAINRLEALAEPLQSLLRLTPEAQRPGAIAALPRLFQRPGNPQDVMNLLQAVLQPYADAPATRTAAQLAVARMLLMVGQAGHVLAVLEHILAQDPKSSGAALMAIELMENEPRAEALVKRYLMQAEAEAGVRLSYAQTLGAAQRHSEAAAQLVLVTQALPKLAQAWLTLGALQVDLGQKAQAEASLRRYIDLRLVQATEQQGTSTSSNASPQAEAPAQPPGAADDDAAGAESQEAEGQDNRLTQARLMLAQLATDRGSFKEADDWLAQVSSPRQALEVQARRALLLARQGKLQEARELIRSAPESAPEQARAKLMAEAQLLRQVDQWKPAGEVLQDAAGRFPDDVDVLYELAMVEEHLGRHDAMEQHLLRVMSLRPDHHHAHNALGYSLADRNLRLDEAHKLVARALELAPGDPFITDSMGWVEYRQGRLETARALLQQAYSARPDVEIGIHLGEVLWVSGQKEEALRIWQQARERDRSNKLLQDTLARLKVPL